MKIEERRKTRRTCGSCTGRVDGECRALPPQLVARPDGRVMVMYPPVHEERPACRDLYQHDRRGLQPDN